MFRTERFMPSPLKNFFDHPPLTIQIRRGLYIQLTISSRHLDIKSFYIT